MKLKASENSVESIGRKAADISHYNDHCKESGKKNISHNYSSHSAFNESNREDFERFLYYTTIPNNDSLNLLRGPFADYFPLSPLLTKPENFRLTENGLVDDSYGNHDTFDSEQHCIHDVVQGEQGEQDEKDAQNEVFDHIDKESAEDYLLKLRTCPPATIEELKKVWYEDKFCEEIRKQSRVFLKKQYFRWVMWSAMKIPQRLNVLKLRRHLIKVADFKNGSMFTALKQ